MDAVEVTWLAAEVSLLKLKWHPCFIRAVRVVDDRTIVVRPSKAPVSEALFWESAVDVDVYIPDPAVRRGRYHEYRASYGCNTVVTAFAAILKELVDQGVPIVHKGHDVTNIVVLNTINMDVSDLLGNCLRLRDWTSGTEVSVLATNSEQRSLSKLPKSVLLSFGWGGIPPQNEYRYEQQERILTHFGNTVPHWWLAVVVDAPEERKMLHIDLCGSAYDSTALVPLHDTWAPFKTFVTPELEITKHPHLAHKLLLLPTLRGHNTVCLQPLSLRHLRCFHWADASGVEITTVEKYVDRNGHDLDAEFHSLLDDLRQLPELKIKPGNEVQVWRLKTRKELNGRFGIVQSDAVERRSGRIAVLVQGLKHPISLKLSCVRLRNRRKQYLLQREMLSEINNVLLSESAGAAPVRKSRDNCKKIDIHAGMDDDMEKALSLVTSGKMKFSNFGDERVKRGIRKLLPKFRAIYNSLWLSMSQGLAIAEHPRAQDAIKLINLMQSTKERALERDLIFVGSDGAVPLVEGSDAHRVMVKIKHKILADDGLMDVFNRLDARGLFKNPAKNAFC